MTRRLPTAPWRPFCIGTTSVVVVAAVVSMGCRAREDAFWNTVFPCTTDGECGTTKAGRPMICYPGSSLADSSGFCAEACDPSKAPDTVSSQTCAPSGSSGALLKKCRPQASHLHPEDKALGCPGALSCYRTSLLEDTGVCLKTDVCSHETPCPGNSGAVCSGVVLESLLPDTSQSLNVTFRTDSFQCVRNHCQTESTDCGAGACFGDYYHHGPPLDDLCVPRCDSGLHCPPNYTCARSAQGAPSAPKICIPGLPGMRCTHNQDCLIGTCVDVGLESNVCALLPCTSDDTCTALNSSLDRFVCARAAGVLKTGATGSSGPGSGWCVALGAFHGANCCQAGMTCDGTPSCSEGQSCLTYGAVETNMVHGECRVPCVDGSCPARGGVPHVCLGPNNEGGCYPATLGMPCALGASCIAPLTCQAAAADPRSLYNYSASICTMACSSDADCASEPLASDGYCGCEDATNSAAAGGCRDGGPALCRVKGRDGVPCERAEQCTSRNCNERLGICVAPLHP